VGNIIIILIILGLIIYFQENIKKDKRKNRQKQKRKKEEIKTKIQNNTTINGYNSLYKNERKKAFEENRKKRYREFMKQNKEKGKEFELYTGKEYEKKGYIVSYNGIGKNKKDNGIDLIAKNNNEILLIQCKNWKSKKITHKEMKEFIGNCTVYKEKNIINANKNIRYIFVTSNYILDKSAEYFIKDNQNILEYKVIQYNN